MPHIERTAHVGWDGNLARGGGVIDAASGAFARLPYSLPSRIGESGGKTSPEELLAAAEADGGLDLRRVLDTVCDTHQLVERDDGAWVELTKNVAAATGAS